MIEYTAQASSPIVNGEVKLTIADKSFTATALFGIAEVPFAEINEILFADYTVTIKADSGSYVFSRMGEWAERFHDALCEKFDKAVLRAMFEKDKPKVTATGDYSYAEGANRGTTPKAPVSVFDDCITVLPRNLGARRIPMCFISSMEKSSYALTLKLDTGESYTLARLGYDTEPIEEAIEKGIRALREKAAVLVKNIDPSLTAAQASQLAQIMPEGAAATFGQIINIAPSFVAALEGNIAKTRAGEYFDALGGMCDTKSIYIGIRKNDMKMIATPSTAQNMYWLIAPSPNGRYATVEFSEADTATFVYKTSGSFDNFAKQLNRALEAIDFKREVISMPDEDLKKPENADYYMAAKRTAALQFIRKSFADRVVHSNPEAWKSKLTGIWNSCSDISNLSGLGVAP